jgi:hypothetical protein
MKTTNGHTNTNTMDDVSFSFAEIILHMIICSSLMKDSRMKRTITNDHFNRILTCIFECECWDESHTLLI